MQYNNLIIDLSYLRPSILAHEIIHDGIQSQIFKAYYIKHGEQTKGTRKIFENVQYDSFENQLIKDIEEECIINQIKVPNDWKKSDFLKIQYSGKCKLKESMKKLQINLAWRANPVYHCLNPKSLDFLVKFIIKDQQQGIIYTYGRDRKFRPIIILNAHLIDTDKYDKECIVQALSYLMGNVRNYMMIPGKVENWIFMLETNKIGVFGLPLKGLGVIIDCMSVNFCGCLEKMYILNPSTGLDITWGAIQSLIDSETKQKINFISTKTMKNLQELIDPDQLQAKYGGTRNNLTTFWPPINLDLQDGYTITPSAEMFQQEKVVEDLKNKDDLVFKQEIEKMDDLYQDQKIENSKLSILKRQLSDEAISPIKQNKFPNSSISNQPVSHETIYQQGNPQDPPLVQGTVLKKVNAYVSIMDSENINNDSFIINHESVNLQAQSHGNISQFVTFGKVSNNLFDSNTKIQQTIIIDQAKHLDYEKVKQQISFQDDSIKQNQQNYNIPMDERENDQLSVYNQFGKQHYPEIEGETKASHQGCCSRVNCLIF